MPEEDPTRWNGPGRLLVEVGREGRVGEVDLAASQIQDPSRHH